MTENKTEAHLQNIELCNWVNSLGQHRSLKPITVSVQLWAQRRSAENNWRAMGNNLWASAIVGCKLAYSS